MANKAPTCQPPSRIKTWDRNACSDGRSNPTKCGWRHHVLYMSGFGDLADVRVIIIEGHIHTGLCLASHAGPYNVAMSRPNANGRIPSFYSGGLAVMTNKSPTCQPPSRIKTWKRNMCSDGRSNQTKSGSGHHSLCISGFGVVAGARVIIAGQCEGHSMVSVLPIMMAHTTIQRGHVKTQRQCANSRFLFGRVGGHDDQVSNLPTTLPNKNLGTQHV